MKRGSNHPESGIVGRVAGNNLAYVVSSDHEGFLPLTPSSIELYKGGDLTANNVFVGSEVRFTYDAASGEIRDVTVAVENDPTRAELADEVVGFGSVPVPKSVGRGRWHELSPTTAPEGTCLVTRSLPIKTRTFGRLIDVTQLRAGDLMLSRAINPDFVSKEISRFQVAGGYANSDSAWTHAAMYVGDGESIVEATFANPLAGDVRLTSLDEYADGTYAFRFRRPKWTRTERDGWRACVRALRRLREPYDFPGALRLWYRSRVKGTLIGSANRLGDTPLQMVCSSLYADAHNEAGGCRLGEVMGACVPAWLSVSDQFDDVSCRWLEIAQ